VLLDFEHSAEAAVGEQQAGGAGGGRRAQEGEQGEEGADEEGSNGGRTSHGVVS
jgi:hypothetical protein